MILNAFNCKLEFFGYFFICFVFEAAHFKDTPGLFWQKS